MKLVASCQLQVAGKALCFVLSALCFQLTAPLHAQTDIPIGTWRMHLSYNAIKSVALAGNKVYGAAESGLLIFDREDNSLSSYNTLNGLTSTGISCIAYDADHDQLLIAYADGGLDILKDNEVINFSRLKNSNTITGSKKINHITVQQNFAYLATDYGVVVFDLQQIELKETWRDLGSSGETLKIFQSSFANDSIFLATNNGVLIGSLQDNLLDFANWKRFSSANFANPIVGIASFNNKVYASINNVGIFRYENGLWTMESSLPTSNFSFLCSSADHLLIGSGADLWKMNASGSPEKVASDKITLPLTAMEDEQNKLWIGDQKHGLISDLTGSFVSHIPNGPTVSKAFRLKFENGVLYALAGGFSNSGAPLGNPGDLNFFENGSWQVVATTFNDLTDISASNEVTWLASFGGGLERTDASGTVTLFDNTNSPLENVNPPAKSVYISSLQPSAGGLWVANYGASQPLHLFRQDGTSVPYSFAFTQARFPLDLIVDFENNVWMRIDPARGGGLIVLNPDDNSTLLRTETTGNGALPNRLVYSFAVDHEGLIWTGTQEGIAYFFSADADAVKPIFENRFLLRNEKITAIKVDAGNRKWIGTENGVWLFNPTGEELIHNFTVENSPLLSNSISDIEINTSSGEVFFATDKGIISYRSDATNGDAAFTSVKIFPNPVTSDFSGTVGISGLASDAFVKITDVSGKLIWQTQANGGTATWNVRDYNGRRASTGIYLVFAATQDGKDSAVGKIAVIE